MTVYKIGLEYKVNSTWTTRIGYNHGKSPIPSSETVLNILAPATVEDHLTLSASWFLAPDQELTIAYMHAFENTIEGDPSDFLGGGTADISMYQDSLGVAYTWNL
jgi:long-chain fatty acid transport protein